MTNKATAFRFSENWKKNRYRVKDLGIPQVGYRKEKTMDDNWLYVDGADVWLYNIHTKQFIRGQRHRGTHFGNSVLIDSTPTDIPLVATYYEGILILKKFATSGDVRVYQAAHLKATHQWRSSTGKQNTSNYLRQVAGKQLLMGRGICCKVLITSQLLTVH